VTARRRAPPTARRARLEDRYPAAHPLLPRDPAARARCRAIELIADTRIDAAVLSLTLFKIFRSRGPARPSSRSSRPRPSQEWPPTSARRGSPLGSRVERAARDARGARRLRSLAIDRESALLVAAVALAERSHRTGPPGSASDRRSSRSSLPTAPSCLRPPLRPIRPTRAVARHPFKRRLPPSPRTL
jgi:hypothetical protein